MHRRTSACAVEYNELSPFTALDPSKACLLPSLFGTHVGDVWIFGTGSHGHWTQDCCSCDSVARTLFVCATKVRRWPLEVVNNFI